MSEVFLLWSYKWGDEDPYLMGVFDSEQKAKEYNHDRSQPLLEGEDREVIAYTLNEGQPA